MTIQILQEDVLQYLGSPAAHLGRPVRRIDTHAASVFLTGARALKVKRAVKLPYLDYSTLELRKRACLSEIEVNRRFAPELYVGLARITKEQDGSLQIDGAGDVVEWAVEMQRFDEALTLDQYSKNNEISPDIAKGVVKRLIEVQQKAPMQDVDSWIAALESFLHQHHQIFSKHSNLFDLVEAKFLLEKSLQLLAEKKALIRARAEAGLLVRGHGDLHLGNIALIKGDPVIFDAVEFDPLIAAGDVLYDLAFFVMDLCVNKQAAAANAALNEYIRPAQNKKNIEALTLLPLFLSLRSSIRAVVALARYSQHGAYEDAETARKYFEFAVHILRPVVPELIALGGLSGTGKSHLAKLLAPFVRLQPGAIVLRSDVYRKSLFGVDETRRLEPHAYSRQVSEVVYYSMMADAWRILSGGYAVILDAVFANAEDRLSAEHLATEAGVNFSGLVLRADIETRVTRVECRSGDASDADRVVVLKQRHDFNNPPVWKFIDSSGSGEKTLELALQELDLSHKSNVGLRNFA